MRKCGKSVPYLMATVLLIAALTAPEMCLATSNDPNVDNYLELSIEDLLGMEVTSVSKRSQPLHDAAAAIFVVTGEDIEQMGATSIPEALRRVPGLQVSQIDSQKWAVTSRGFNGRFSNKLLVLIDGRSVYTTSFSGVYWEVQDLMLEDIDRIEVIRGPGAALWGANAVNGVINIITKHAADTQGGVAVAGAGDILNGFGALRWGTKTSDKTYARVYVKAFDRDEFHRIGGEPAGDEWHMLRSGFRLDTERPDGDSLTLQGDIYQGTIQQQSLFPSMAPPYSFNVDETLDVYGGNLIGRWNRTLSPTSEFSFQVTYDRSVRSEMLGDQAKTQLDYDFQHQFASDQHRVVWGLGFRHIDDLVKPGAVVVNSEGQRDFALFSGFIQDEITFLDERLALILGNKIEHYQQTGVEIQPSVRMMWQIRQQHRLWAAVSRAVRTPARTEDEVGVLTSVLPPSSPGNPTPLPLYMILEGNEDLAPENLLAYEAGYRFVEDQFSVDLAAFYNDYTQLQNVQLGEPELRVMNGPPHIVQPVFFVNETATSTYGAELAVAWQTTKRLRWDLAYSYFYMDLLFSSLSGAATDLTPRHQGSLSCALQPASAWNLNLGLRYVDKLISRGYREADIRTANDNITLDARLAWKMRDSVEVSLVGQNLLDKRHFEYSAEGFLSPTEVPRSYYLKMRWGF